MMEKDRGFVAELKMAWKKRITARTANELTVAETPMVRDASTRSGITLVLEFFNDPLDAFPTAVLFPAIIYAFML